MADLETVSIFCGTIEDITPGVEKDGETYMEVTMSDVDPNQIVSEFGIESLLSCMNEEEVIEYFDNRKHRDGDVENAEG